MLMASDMDDFWVFGYGSLIWDPGFAVAEPEWPPGLAERAGGDKVAPK